MSNVVETMTNKEASEILRNMLNNQAVDRGNEKSGTILKINEAFMKAIVLLEDATDDEEEKSSLEVWAENEVAIACKREKGTAPKEEWDYACACYMSALKSFRSLCKDGNSGYSIGFTKSILDRLIETKPLTPIEDAEDVWNICTRKFDDDGVAEYQCKRISSLFKTVHKDGTVTYSDIDRCYGKDINTGATYTGGLTNNIIHELYPITMPYIPGERIKTETEDFLTDRKNGDYDTVGVFSALVNGEKIDINRYFAESDDYPDQNEVYPGWVEIKKEEYDNRRAKADVLRVQMKKETCEKSCQLCNVCQKKEEYQNNRTYCDDFIPVDYKPAKEDKSNE